MDNKTQNMQKKDQNAKNTALINLKTVNVCGLSERTKFTLNRYIQTDGIDILALQETDTAEWEKLELLHMFCIYVFLQ